MDPKTRNVLMSTATAVAGAVIVRSLKDTRTRRKAKRAVNRAFDAVADTVQNTVQNMSSMNFR